MRYQVDILLPLKPQKILYYFGLCWKILFANQFVGFFTFDLFDLLILTPGVRYYIVFVIIIKVWNIIRDSLCNKYAERSKAFSLLQENFF